MDKANKRLLIILIILIALSIASLLIAFYFNDKGSDLKWIFALITISCMWLMCFAANSAQRNDLKNREKERKMEQHEFCKKIVENKELLDKLSLPEPEIGEEIWDYAERARDIFKDVTLPEDYDGDLFYWLDAVELGDYLGMRFNMKCEEESRWVMY